MREGFNGHVCFVSTCFAAIAWSTGTAVDPTLKTAKEVASEFGLTDSDLTQSPPELYDCIRHYANTGPRHLSHEHRDEGDVEGLKTRLLAMQDKAAKRFAGNYVLTTRPRYVFLRDGSGMYHTVKFAILQTFVVLNGEQGVAIDSRSATLYARQIQSPGDFDRSFLSRGSDGRTYLHEEMCSIHERSGDPILYDERFPLEELEGSWGDYLKGDIIVLRLNNAEAQKRQKAQDKFNASNLSGGPETAADGVVEALKEGAGIGPAAKVNVEVVNKDLSVGPALLYVKQDAMLWIESAENVVLTTVTEK